jgi:hypothetical protein
VLRTSKKPCGSYLTIFYRVGITGLFLRISRVREVI